MAIEALTNPSSTVQSINSMSQTGASVAKDHVQVSKPEGTQDKNDNQNSNEKQGGYEIEKAADVTTEDIKKAVDDINQKIKPVRTSCQFSYHEETNRISITVKDEDKDKVIREIPGEKALDIIAKTLELEGLLLDEKR